MKNENDQLIKDGSLQNLISKYQDSDVVSQIEKSVSGGQVANLDVSSLVLFPLFSADNYPPKSLELIERSIQSQGIMIPIFVFDYQGKTTVVNGVKRFIALKKLHINTVPSIFIHADLNEVFIYILNNMLSNKDNGLVQATAYKALIDYFGMTERDICQVTKLSHGQINNTMRLLKLSDKVRKLIIDGKLSYAKARLLVGLAEADQEMLAGRLIFLNVRECEEAVRSFHQGVPSAVLEEDVKLTYHSEGNKVIVETDDPQCLKELIEYLSERGKQC